MKPELKEYIPGYGWFRFLKRTNYLKANLTPEDSMVEQFFTSYHIICIALLIAIPFYFV